MFKEQKEGWSGECETAGHERLSARVRNVSFIFIVMLDSRWGMKEREKSRMAPKFLPWKMKPFTI